MKKISKKTEQVEKAVEIKNIKLGAGEDNVLNNGMKKENQSDVAPDLYCDACGAALKQVGTNAFNLNDDCNEFPKLNN